MDINIKELQIIANLLFEHLQKAGQQTVNLPFDFYWSIPKEAKYNPYQQPTFFTIGQLSGDINELKSVIQGNKEPIGYGLVWLASIIRAVGEEVAA